ncbi:MAG TPA: DUF192 domain-containing protein [Acidimicrobiales bacterium]|nr:DUF192 domain-containing protein [Acidimicrobiales bacterium]
MHLDRERLNDPPAWVIRRLRQSILALVALGVLAFLIVGANRPANPYLVPPGGRISTKAFTGFETTYVTITAALHRHSAARPQCMLLASTPAQQQRGLMNQTSLHGFRGMVFEFDRPTDVTFYMKDTPVPLSIAWFAADGTFLSSTDMVPCPASTLICPTYSPQQRYGMAIEVPKGNLGGLGIGPGSSVQLGGPCAG